MKLKGGMGSAQIVCSLEEVSLDDKIKYEALSYVWGTSPERITIKCGSGELHITVSLHSALSALRHRITGSRVLWADAVCINQNDIPERQKQVRLMGELYSRAQYVYIWLGNDCEEEALNAHALLMQFNRTCRKSIEAGTSDSITMAKAVRLGLKSWESLAQLLNRPWFGRTWIIQEAVNARKTLIVAGKQRMSIDWLLTAAYYIRHFNMMGILGSYGAFEGIAIIQSIEKFKNRNDIQPRSEEEELLSALVSTRGPGATDPRDKLYGILGLVSETAASPFAVDYSISTVDLYLKLAQHFLAIDGLRFLCCASVVPEDHPVQTPSWVPNWAHRGLGPMTMKHCYFAASGSTSPAAVINQDGKHISVRGKIVDTVLIREKDFHPTILDPAWLDKYLPFENPSQVEKAQRITQCIALAFGDHALGCCSIPEDQYEAFVRMLFCNMGDDGNEAATETVDLVGRYLTHSLRVSSMSREDIASYLNTMTPNTIEDLVQGEKRLDANFFGTFGLTESGRWGWFPLNLVQVGDVVALFYGSNSPFLLRHAGTASVDKVGETLQYQLVGEAYVHGVMKGEALQQDKAETITLC